MISKRKRAAAADIDGLGTVARYIPLIDKVAE